MFNPSGLPPPGRLRSGRRRTPISAPPRDATETEYPPRGFIAAPPYTGDLPAATVSLPDPPGYTSAPSSLVMNHHSPDNFARRHTGSPHPVASSSRVPQDQPSMISSSHNPFVRETPPHISHRSVGPTDSRTVIPSASALLARIHPSPRPLINFSPSSRRGGLPAVPGSVHSSPSSVTESPHRTAVNTPVASIHSSARGQAPYTPRAVLSPARVPPLRPPAVVYSPARVASPAITVDAEHFMTLAGFGLRAPAPPAAVPGNPAQQALPAARVPAAQVPVQQAHRVPTPRVAPPQVMMPQGMARPRTFLTPPLVGTQRVQEAVTPPILLHSPFATPSARTPAIPRRNDRVTRAPTSSSRTVPNLSLVKPLLSRANFMEWYRPIVHAIRSTGLFNHINASPDGAVVPRYLRPSYPPAEPDEDDEDATLEYDRWYADDALVLQILTARLGPEPTRRLGIDPAGSRTAREVFSTLMTHFGFGDFGANARVLDELTQTTCTSSGVLDYVDRYQDTLTALLSVGHPIIAQDILRRFCLNLPPQYYYLRNQHLVTLSTLGSDNFQPIYDLFAHIQDVERTLPPPSVSQPRPAPPRAPRPATTPSVSSSLTAPPINRSDLLCTYCNRNGHVIDTCHRRQNAEAAAAQTGQSNSNTAAAAAQPRRPPAARTNLAAASLDQAVDESTTDVAVGGGEDLGDPPEELPITTDNIDPFTAYMFTSTGINHDLRDSADAYAPSDRLGLPPLSYLACNLPPAPLFGPHKAPVFTDAHRALFGGRFSSMLDSGTNFHLVRDEMSFHTYSKTGAMDVETANCSVLRTHGIGSVVIEVSYQGKPVRLRLHNCLHAPDAPISLISTGALAERGVSTHFDPPPLGTTVIWPHNHPLVPGLVLEATVHDRLSMLNVMFVPRELPVACSALAQSPLSAWDAIPKPELTPRLWHRRLAHAGLDAVRAVLTKEYATGVSFTGTFDRDRCVSCVVGKEPQQPYEHNGHRASRPGERLHTDNSGPFAQGLSRRGHKHWNAILDDFSSFGSGMLLMNKSQSHLHVEHTVCRMENITGHPVSSFRMDGAPELSKGVCGSWLSSRGIAIQVTAPYAHQQNGRIERWIRRIDEGALVLLADSGLSSMFHGFAILYTIWICNRLPTSSLPAGLTPHEALKSSKPDLSPARIFGCVCYVLTPAELRTKGAMKRFPAIFVGLVEDRKGWLVLDLRGKEWFSRDVIWDELRPGRLGVPKNVPSTTYLPRRTAAIAGVHLDTAASLAAERRASLRSARRALPADGGAAGGVDEREAVANGGAVADDGATQAVVSSFLARADTSLVTRSPAAIADIVSLTACETGYLAEPFDTLASRIRKPWD